MEIYGEACSGEISIVSSEIQMSDILTILTIPTLQESI